MHRVQFDVDVGKVYDVTRGRSYFKYKLIGKTCTILHVRPNKIVFMVLRPARIHSEVANVIDFSIK